jgi:membrane peptidoglycan carboxypeptidase
MKLLGQLVSKLVLLTLRDSGRSMQGKLCALYASYQATLKPQIPATVVDSLIVAEDHRFYRHYGIDPIAVARAICNLTLRGTLSGGSTIEQQLVRTITCRYERSLGRKLREILLACVVQRTIPKSDIPGLYLSIAYFGWHMNGIQQACRRLGIELSKMTQRQAACLVSRLKYPEPRNPSSRRTRLIATRTDYLLRTLEKQQRATHLSEVEVKVNATHFDF